MSVIKKIKAFLPLQLRDQLRAYAYRAETTMRRFLFSEIETPPKGGLFLLGISFSQKRDAFAQQILVGC